MKAPALPVTPFSPFLLFSDQSLFFFPFMFFEQEPGKKAEKPAVEAEERLQETAFQRGGGGGRAGGSAAEEDNDAEDEWEYGGLRIGATEAPVDETSAEPPPPAGDAWGETVPPPAPPPPPPQRSTAGMGGPPSPPPPAGGAAIISLPPPPPPAEQQLPPAPPPVPPAASAPMPAKPSPRPSAAASPSPPGKSGGAAATVSKQDSRGGLLNSLAPKVRFGKLIRAPFPGLHGKGEFFNLPHVCPSCRLLTDDEEEANRGHERGGYVQR